MAQRRRSPARSIRGKHILIVEDHLALGRILQKLLAGYNSPAHATTAKQALEHIERKQPDLILLDITLPDMNGLELAKRLRQNNQIKSMPILAMSGRDVERPKYVEAGCDDFILKPFDERDLIARMAKLLRRRR
jgi:two-component system phosphate regulon response regulator PhoB